MEVKAVQKFVKISPKKLRIIADAARKMSPEAAIERLPFLGKRGADPIISVIKTAIANAKVKGISNSELIFKELQINEGPRLKRGRPVSRGRWHPYKRRMSHIRVVLETKVQSPKNGQTQSGKNTSVLPKTSEERKTPDKKENKGKLTK